MTLSKDRGDREYNKFVEDSVGDTCVRTLESRDSSQIAGLYKGQILSNSVASVPADSDTLLLNLTVGAGETYIGDISATGTADGIYTLRIDGLFASQRRTAWNDRNAIFKFQFLKLTAGQVITLHVTHEEDVAQDYSADLIYIEA